MLRSTQNTGKGGGHHGGFSIIELMVVIAIIGILATITIASLSDPRKKARDVQRISDVSQLRIALERHYNTCKRFPSELANNVIDLADGTGCPTGVTFASFIGTALPVPPGGTHYSYWLGASPYTSYTLGAQLETDHAVFVEDVDVPTPDCLDASPNFGYCVTN